MKGETPWSYTITLVGMGNGLTGNMDKVQEKPDWSYIPRGSGAPQVHWVLSNTTKQPGYRNRKGRWLCWSKARDALCQCSVSIFCKGKGQNSGFIKKH